MRRARLNLARWVDRGDATVCAPPEGTLCAETDSARAESPQCEFVQESLQHDWEFASDSRVVDGGGLENHCAGNGTACLFLRSDLEKSDIAALVS